MALNFLYPTLRRIIDPITGFRPEVADAEKVWRW